MIVERVTSRYNFSIPLERSTLIYNSASGAVLELEGTDAQELLDALAGDRVRIAAGSLPNELWQQLCREKFLIADDEDEIAEQRDRFLKARGHTPPVITITTTMDCNLGCYYCYESRTKERLHTDSINDIVEQAGRTVDESEFSTLHVDWYGGEPFLNVEFLEKASLALQEMCSKKGARYSASVISNGTEWPSDVDEFVKKHKIRQVQITFDGLEKNHNKRRRYRQEYRDGDNQSSFALARELVDQLVHLCHTDIRFNIDRRNQYDLKPFVDMAVERGWFGSAFRCVFQPARLSSYSEKSAFMRNDELTLMEYDALRSKIREWLPQEQVEESESPDGFPYPKTSACAALSRPSQVIGADRLLYRCGLQVGEKHRATGSLDTDDTTHFRDRTWWDSFDPTCMEKCATCSFLPVCWSGCPKKHLEGDKHAIDEQGQYWRDNLARLVASSHTQEPFNRQVTFSDSDQFRARHIEFSKNIRSADPDLEKQIPHRKFIPIASESV